METAVGAVVRVPPRDDAGAPTADRYDWQAAMAAADGLSMFARDLDSDGQIPSECTSRVLCEHHEDWVAMRGDEAELVSGKHRDPSTGAWTTINSLVGDGGIGHLFERWSALHRKPTVRLVTCAALSGEGPKQLKDATKVLKGVCSKPADLTVDIVNTFAKALHKYSPDLPKHWPPRGEPLNPTHLDDACAFLSILTIHDERPSRSLVEHAAPSMYVQPILDQLRRSEVPARAVWQAVLQLFRVRMRARGPVPAGALPAVLGLAPDMWATTIDTDERVLASRIVTVHDIATAIRISLANPAGYIPLARPVRLTRLSVKMARGGCAETSIERAEKLRIDFNRYWRIRRDSLPGSVAERPALDRALMRIADEATAISRTTTGHWGASFWMELGDRVADELSLEKPQGLDDQLALGGICDLATKCRVWFGPSFDVDAEIARLRAERIAER